ncbi:MarR family winged helix-turn-helix transcriptional regulator [Clostridium sp. 'White wine YQ']|uniref:MarR family winged helix-turn-helix transcriptional regulator n=1 Tax=Clostridium sp. 'White wine YQ' TaxID=3027474 RepID=UPI0023657A3D|nr:MarR family transcriptional regulator [Clostridium sp. 'White wine YQ']MDD7793275.1 MarR family transcriptional regulator [Clostridium sp. 'White wine YQ']
MNRIEQVINELLVKIFNDILVIEQKTLKNGVLNDLSVTEIHTIEAIGMYTARNMSEVAADLKITLGTLTTAINKLIKKGYVERNRIETDRRVVQVQLTKKGKLAYRLHEKFHGDMIKDIVDGLEPAEEEILVTSLSKLSKFFKEKNDL